jgi:acyl-CoA thioesterase II
MSEVLNELLDLLKLEPIGENRFRGQCQDLGFRSLFGGQVLGQSLSAAMQTLPVSSVTGSVQEVDGEWWPNSLHAYFLRPGSVQDPLEIEVSAPRDGRSFANRQVTVTQKGKPLLSLICSFQRPEEGFEHQPLMPFAPGPEGIASQVELARQWRDCFPERLRPIYTADKPIEMRVVNPANVFTPDVRAPEKQVWMKADDRLAGSVREHTSLLAYASDYNLITTALYPHGVSVYQKEMQVASLDHSIWFHRPFRMDEWLLYCIDSPSASGGRGFCRGQIFNQQGVLVASVAQEGLIRKRS